MSAKDRPPKRLKVAKATSYYPKHAIICWYGDPTSYAVPESSIERGFKPNCRINDEGALLATTEILEGEQLILPYTPEEGAGVRPPPAFTYLELKLEIWNQSKTIKPQYDQVGKKLDNTPGSGMSGHLTPGDMLTALLHLKMDESSFFWDYGCSTGMVAAAASLCFGARSGGCDINELAIKGFNNIKKGVVQSDYPPQAEVDAVMRMTIWHNNRCPRNITHAYAFWTGWDLHGKQDAWRRMRDSTCCSIILLDKESGHKAFESSTVIFPHGVGTGRWTRTEIAHEFKQSVGGAAYKARLWTRTPEMAKMALRQSNQKLLLPLSLDTPVFKGMPPLIAYGKERRAEISGNWMQDDWETSRGLGLWHKLFEIKKIPGKGYGVVSKIHLEPGQIAWVEALAPLTKTNRLQEYTDSIQVSEHNVYNALHRPYGQSPLNLGVPSPVSQLIFVNDNDYYCGANVREALLTTTDLETVFGSEIKFEGLRKQVANIQNVADSTRVEWVAVMAELPIYPGEEIVWEYNHKGAAEWHALPQSRQKMSAADFGKRRLLEAAFADLSLT